MISLAHPRRALHAAALLIVSATSASAQGTVRPVGGDTALRQPNPSRPPAGQAVTDSAVAAADPLTRLVGRISYRSLGPAAFSGRVTALAVPTPYHRTMYVGAAGGGVWKTTNAGTTWRQVGDSLRNQTVGDLAVAPSDTSIVWVGTGERNSLRSQSWGNGVHKSTDGGRTWHLMGLADSRAIARVVIHPTNPNIVYVAALGHLWGANAERGVYKTTDGGAHWSRILFVNDTTGATDLELDPSNPEVVYAAMWHRVRLGGSHMQGTGTGSGIYKSVNGGASWTRLTDPARATGLPTREIGRASIAISARHPATLYAMVAVDRAVTEVAAAPFGGVFRSTDAGEHWTQVNDLAANPHYYYDEIVVDPTNDQHVYVLASPVLVSKDGGRTFAPDSLYNVHVDNHALWIDPADSAHMVLGNDGGAYTTFDGGRAWEHAQLPIGQFYTVIVDSSVTPYRVCGGLQDNGVWCGPSRTRDSTGVTDADWYSVNGGDGMWVQVPWHDPHVVYSEWQFGSMSRLDTRTWKRDNIKPAPLDAGGDAGYEYRWGWTAPLILSQHDSTVLYAGANRLFRLHDRGDRGMDFEMLGPDMTRADRSHPAAEGGNTSYHALFSVAESPRDRNVLWTGSDDGLVWLTRDAGRTWANLTANLPKGAPTSCFVSAIAPGHQDAGAAWLTYDCHHRDDYQPHVYRTTDFGRTWTALVRGLPADGGSLTVYADPFNPRVAWVGTAVGAYVTVDGGRLWQRMGRNLPWVPVEKFALSYRQRELVVGTHGRGAWVADVRALEEMSDTLLAERAHLFAVPPALQYRYADTYPAFGSRPWVSPNPPRGAVIAYWLRDAQPGTVDLYVTTAAGDTVRKLTGPGYAGLQTVTWDLGRDRPRPRELGGPTDPRDLRRVEPGEYLVTMSVGGRRMTQRVRVEEWPAGRVGRIP
ncbi:MAG: hypothetical protein JWN79_3225 [Gemmatimonadetes bacterium]|nr:hypothetical protein [Gemmatimonadota bacterium]